MLLQAFCIISYPSVNSNWSYSPETPNSGQNRPFLSRVTLKFDRWHWKTIGHLFYATSRFVHHLIAMGHFKLELESGNAKFGSKSAIFAPCDHEIWLMTLKNKRAPPLCSLKLYAWFNCHMQIQTGVRVRKRLSWMLTSVTLTFDLGPWPFAWTSLLSMVITHENFMMMGTWWKRCDGQTDRRTDRRTGPVI